MAGDGRRRGEARGAVARVGAQRRGVAFRGAVHEVGAEAAVDVNVDEARHDVAVAGVDDGRLRVVDGREGREAIDGRDARAPHEHGAPLQHMVGQDNVTGEEQRRARHGDDQGQGARCETIGGTRRL